MSDTEHTADPALLDLTGAEPLRLYLVSSLTQSGASLQGWTSRFAGACRWYSDLLGQGFDHIPFFVVHDLGLLLLEGMNFPFRLMVKASENQGEAIQSTPFQRLAIRYQDRVLNRVLSMPRFTDFVDAVSERKAKHEVVSTLLERLLVPLARLPLPKILTSPVLVRQSGPGPLTPLAALDVLRGQAGEEAAAALTEEARGEVLQQICEAYEIGKLDLLGPHDLFVVRNFDVLHSRAKRLAARQVAFLEHQIGQAPPPPPMWRKETPLVPVDLNDPGLFPQGGLDQLSTHGSIENLVRSELVYLEDSPDVDLFSLRFVENELLYYTRDEGQLQRAQREVHVVLELWPESYIQYPDHHARLSTMLRATINRLVDDLFDLFESDALHIALYASGERNDEELGYWSLRFAERERKGEVSFHRLTHVLQPDGLHPTPGAATYFLYLGPEHPPTSAENELTQRTGIKVIWTQVALEVEENGQYAYGQSINAVSPDILEALAAARNRMVWEVFGVDESALSVAS